MDGRMVNAAQGMERVQPNEVMDVWVALEVVCMHLSCRLLAGRYG
jgi:hypothetical protein